MNWSATIRFYDRAPSTFFTEGKPVVAWNSSGTMTTIVLPESEEQAKNAPFGQIDAPSICYPTGAIESIQVSRVRVL